VYVSASLPLFAILLMTVVDSPDYISHFTNLRHLTFADLYHVPRDHHKLSGSGSRKSLVWVHGAIAAIQSPITHLTFEVLVRQPADLDAVDWETIDVLISTREALRSLVQVSVIFLDWLRHEGQDPKSIADPATIRREMPLTSAMGLLNIVIRGPKMQP
jgi:hypothetical protein